MRSLTLAAAAAAAVLAGPALAADPPQVAPIVVPAPTTVASYVSGNVALWGAVAVPTLYRETSYGDVCESEDAFFDWNQDWCRPGFGFGGDARVHYGRGAIGFQLELLGEYMRSMALYGKDEEEFGDPPDPEVPGFHLAGAAHLILRNTLTPIGVFGGVTYTQHMAGDDRPLHAIAGVEIAHVGAANTVYLQAGGLFLIAGEDAIGRMYFGRAGFRHFFGDDTMIEAAFAGGYAPDADSDGTGDTAVWLQGALGFERGIGSGPLSVLAGYQADYYRVNADEVTSVVVHTFKIGVRMSFGGTLAEQNATGARTFTLPNLFAPITYTGDMN